MQARFKKEEYDFPLSLLIFQLLGTSENLTCSETTGDFVHICLGFPLVRRHFLKQVISKGRHCCNFK